MNRQFFIDKGKEGARIKNAERYKVIKELTKYYNKEEHNKLIKWPSIHLITLLEGIKKHE